MAQSNPQGPYGYLELYRLCCQMQAAAGKPMVAPDLECCQMERELWAAVSGHRTEAEKSAGQGDSCPACLEIQRLREMLMHRLVALGLGSQVDVALAGLTVAHPVN